MSRIFTSGNNFYLPDASVLSLPIGPPGVTFAAWIKFNVTGVTTGYRGFWNYDDSDATPPTAFWARAAWSRETFTRAYDEGGQGRNTPPSEQGFTFPEDVWIPLVVAYNFDEKSSVYRARVKHPYQADTPRNGTGPSVYVHDIIAPTFTVGDYSGALNGKMAHLTIYGRGIEEEEIDAFLAGAHPLTINDAAHYWPMLDGTGDVTDTVNSIALPMVGTVGEDAADNPPVDTIAAPVAPPLTLNLIPSIGDGKQRISDPLGEYLPLPEGELPSFLYRTHLVTADATGGGDGSSQNPWTLKEACEQCEPGMIIGVKAGVYVGQQAMGYVNEDGDQANHVAFHCRVSGTESKPIYFVAEHPAAYTLNQAEYTDLRSGATVNGFGWPVFGQMGSNRPNVEYVHWIGMYSDARAPNNKMWGDSNKEAYMTSFFGNGNYCSIQKCRLIRDNELEPISNIGNKSFIRIERNNDSVFCDNHMSIVGSNQGVNNSCITLYFSTRVKIHNNTFVSDTTSPTCFYMKVGEPRGRVIEGIHFFNNRMEGFSEQLRILGPTIKNIGEEYRSHIYGNLSIGASTFMNWATSDGQYVMNGIRFTNNTVINAENGFIMRPHHDAPDLNPRDIGIYNNIVYNTETYINDSVSTGKVPPGFPWFAQFSAFDRNCLWGVTNEIKSNDPDISSKTWADWVAFTDADPLRITDNNSVIADPDFVDEVDYKLNPGSPCAALGRDVYGLFGAGGAVIPAGCYVTGDETIGVR
jgi:hypothetical protein